MNSNSNFINYILSSSKNVKVTFVFLFVIFGLTIAFISYFVNLYYENQNMKDGLFNSENNSFINKEAILTDKKELLKNILFSIIESNTFNSYLKNNTNNTNTKDLFNTTMKINNELMQIRYLDQNGQENIRIDRKSIGSKSYFTPVNKLQNKSDRYYFKEVKKLSNGEIWISKMDLNVEDGKIVKPIVPTLRISTPIYISNKFHGTIIINVFIEKLIKQITDSDFFHISIVDKEGNFIYHIENNNGTIQDYSWSKYLKKKHTVYNHFPLLAKRILNSNETRSENLFSKNISNQFYNLDELIFIYDIKENKLEQLMKKQSDYIVIITLIVFFISIPISFLLSIIPVKLSSQLIQTKEALEQKQNIVDKYVPISSTNTQGIITDVSTAFCNLTGYEKDELIGVNHNIISAHDTSIEVYKNLWNSVNTIGKWKGEIKNMDKHGNEFWIILNIHSIKDSNEKTIGFQAYSENITSNKLLYNSSVTDSLTSLYNRRFFDEIISKQIKSIQRDETILAFSIVDIDYFKQYNDIYGHQAGDNALKRVSMVLKNSLHRPNDYAFRLGGEEFGLLFNIKNEEDAYKVSQQIKQNVENLKIEHSKNTASKFITISMGVYIIKADNIHTIDDIYKLCDENLYKAKQSGRNMIV